MSTSGNPKKVLVAVSGGVDSSVALVLLREQGYEVEAAFMKNWDETLAPGFYKDAENGCSTKADQEDARAVCEQLGVPFHIFNFTREYYDNVIEDFFAEYAAGRTPNPDVLCNKYIKFGEFLEKAREMGFDTIATGHYVRRDGDTLLKGNDDNKDQSYFLWTLTPEQLASSLFPVGEYDKSAIRDLAEKHDLVTATKPDSQGICFVGEVDVQGFIESKLGTNSGPIATIEGETVGEHRGLHFYTEGQRQGIGVGGSGLPYYVVRKETGTNTLVVAKGAHHPALYARGLRAVQMSWTGAVPELPAKLSAKIRYRQEDVPCTVESVGNRHACSVQAVFDEPIRSVTPGQSLVLYNNDICLGGGIIQEALYD